MFFQVYEHSLGTEAEKFGPLSIQVEERLRGLDDDLSYFMDRLRKANMEDMVNIVLLSGNFEWIIFKKWVIRPFLKNK